MSQSKSQKQTSIPIESLPEELNKPIFSRGVVIFGHAGDEFDNVARGYENMQWWLSNAGLNMAIVSSERRPTFPTFDELVGEVLPDLGHFVPVETNKRLGGLLIDQLNEAESRTTDPKLRNKLLAVIRYDS